MFRLGKISGCCVSSFPRIRGDVPLGKISGCPVREFSPHTRGCSRSPSSYQLSSSGFPRIRGDVPTGGIIGYTEDQFSPHTRGCSYENRHGAPKPGVFPAYAGMFRFLALAQVLALSFPRIRGDVPSGAILCLIWRKFSPHTRGCSAQLFQGDPSTGVFPAYAGMFRTGFPNQGFC